MDEGVRVALWIIVGVPVLAYLFLKGFDDIAGRGPKQVTRMDSAIMGHLKQKDTRKTTKGESLALNVLSLYCQQQGNVASVGQMLKGDYELKTETPFLKRDGCGFSIV